jgi:hypothetical protein
MRKRTDMTCGADNLPLSAPRALRGGVQPSRGLGVVCLIGWALAAPWDTRSAAASPSPDAIARLAADVRGLGWIVYGARSAQGDWDLFICRPDGSAVRPLTRTPGCSEFSPQVSRDGRRLLYRRIKPDEKLDNNRHGEQGELVVAHSDGTNPQVLGAEGELPWASRSGASSARSCRAGTGRSCGFTTAATSARRPNPSRP